MRNVVLTEELAGLLRQVAKQHMNSFQPRPKRGRRQRRGSAVAAPGETATDDIRGISVGSIAAATTVSVGGPIVPGTGYAKLYDPPGAGNPGTPWQPQQVNTLVENWMFAPVADAKPIKLRRSRRDLNDNWIYVVDVEGCKAVTLS